MAKFLQIRKGSFLHQYLSIIISGVILLIVIISGIVINVNISATRKFMANAVGTSRENQERIDTISQSLLLLGGHSNQVRSHLGFEIKEYPINDKEKESGEGAESDAVLYFKALDKIIENDRSEKNMILFGKFARSLQPLAKKYKLTLKENGPFNIVLIRKKITALDVSLENGEVVLAGITGKPLFLDIQSTGTLSTKKNKEISSLIEKSVKDVDKFLGALKKEKENLARIGKNEGLKELLKERKLTLSAVTEHPAGYALFVKYGKEPVLELGLRSDDLVYFIGEAEYKTFAEFTANVEDQVAALDLRTEKEKNVAESHGKLREIFTDRGFNSVLEGYGLEIVKEFRSDEYFDYYDIFDGLKKRIGSYAVDNYNGDIYLVDRDEVQIGSLQSLDNEDFAVSKKKMEIPADLPPITDFYPDLGGISFLLCGSNENNTDTLIVVNANVKTRKVVMFAVPRDLYYKGRRINTVYFRLGMEQLLKELSTITGLKIEKYIEIDMFAFIEVVNILGGIDITLENDLVDPSYKIKENGIWSTLNYKKGDYHLNGVQALRVARSRHYSSDYERSRRQQKILVALSQKFKLLSIGNIDKLSELLKALQKYVKTNFNIFEMVQYFNKFKDYKIDGQKTLDTQNVLEATYSNIYLMKQKDKEGIIDENFNKGAWILVPRENNWQLIKWYVRKLVAG